MSMINIQNIYILLLIIELTKFLKFGLFVFVLCFNILFKIFYYYYTIIYCIYNKIIKTFFILISKNKNNK